MVQAILAGRKTQTRRICNPQPVLNGAFWEMPAPFGAAWSHTCKSVPAVPGHTLATRNRFGAPGDRLWVKETFGVNRNTNGIYYRATSPDATRNGSCAKWKPSIFCTRGASRITLKITAVRVERLNDISEADAMAEGGMFHDGRPINHHGFRHTPDGNLWTTARASFASLWESINGAGSWETNPWVWVITFKRI